MMEMFCPKCGSMCRSVNLSFGAISNAPEKWGEACMNGLCGWKNYQIQTKITNNTGALAYVDVSIFDNDI